MQRTISATTTCPIRTPIERSRPRPQPAIVTASAPKTLPRRTSLAEVPPGVAAIPALRPTSPLRSAGRTGGCILRTRARNRSSLADLPDRRIRRSDLLGRSRAARRSGRVRLAERQMGISSLRFQEECDSCAVTSVPAGDVEGAVLDQVQKLLAAPELVARTWAAAKRGASPRWRCRVRYVPYDQGTPKRCQGAPFRARRASATASEVKDWDVIAGALATQRSGRSGPSQPRRRDPAGSV